MVLCWTPPTVHVYRAISWRASSQPVHGLCADAVRHATVEGGPWTRRALEAMLWSDKALGCMRTAPSPGERRPSPSTVFARMLYDVPQLRVVRGRVVRWRRCCGATRRWVACAQVCDMRSVQWRVVFYLPPPSSSPVVCHCMGTSAVQVEGRAQEARAPDVIRHSQPAAIRHSQPAGIRHSQPAHIHFIENVIHSSFMTVHGTANDE